LTLREIMNELPKRKHNEAIWLLCFMLGLSKAELALDVDKNLTSVELKKWRAWWRRRERGEPLQYIAGSAPFYGRELGVAPGVLIPRPETECLVEIALKLLEEHPSANVLDIGTGSGAIAITLKLERPDLVVTGTDISRIALRQASANAAEKGARLAFEKHNLFSSDLVRRNWHLVISNPPYLEFGRDRITTEVREWEPRLALEPTSAMGKGLEITRAAWCAERILHASEQARPIYTALELSPRVACFLERRWRKRDSVKRLWREADLAGRKRFLLVSWKEL
jgi:release factor glutamine methyltransferase